MLSTRLRENEEAHGAGEGRDIHSWNGVSTDEWDAEEAAAVDAAMIAEAAAHHSQTAGLAEEHVVVLVELLREARNGLKDYCQIACSETIKRLDRAAAPQSKEA